MKSGFIILVVLVLCLNQALAQPRCGFDEIHKKQIQNDPGYRQRINENEKNILEYVQKNRSRIASTLGSATALYTIPVVVHVVHTGGAVGTIYNPTDAQIQGAIDYLNQIYDGTYPGTAGVGDIQIQFALANRDPNCNTTTGINRIDGSGITNYTANGINAQTAIGATEASVKNFIRWSTTDYYNIWVVNKIDGNDGTSGSFVAGYAYFPGSSATVDGTVILATQMATGQKTLPHEIGHAFALYHPFEGASGTTCSTNADCSMEGDRVCDTDPIIQPTGPCRTGTNACTGTPYNNNTESNFMNYTSCYNSFTAGQKARMLAAAAGIYRLSLSKSHGLNGAYPITPYVAPTSSCSPATNAFGLGGHYAGIMNVNFNNKDYASSTAAADAGYLNYTTNCLRLTELVKGATYSLAITVLGQNQEQLRAWIDYNNDGVFDNTTEQVYINTAIPSNGGIGYTLNTNFTVPSSAVTGIVIKMRIVNDLRNGYANTTDITDACFNPYYGQAEDYPIVLSSGVLPVTLLEFKGKAENNLVALNWKTIAETNTTNFDIEKSIDGVTFNKIGSVDAVGGNYSTPNSYSFIDQQVNKINYYRLAINDNNGSKKYSEVVVVKTTETLDNAITVVNPFTNFIDMKLEKAVTNLKLQLINSNGVVVAEKMFANAATQLRWQLENKALSAGVYILMAVGDEQVMTMKLIKK